MTSRIYHQNVEGAPFKIGDVVKVVLTKDSNIFEDVENGVIGTVYEFDYGQQCGEAYPHDPCIRIKGAYSWYWKEELELVMAG